jgi:peptidyl-prolyl cis-trans isomerase SurA
MLRLLAGAALLALSFAAPAQRLVLVDRIVAVVNKEAITLSELNEAVAGAERQLRRQGIQLPERETLERQVLERLILDRAQLQRARELGIRVEELQLDRAVQRIAEENKLPLAEFRRALERDGVSFEAFRDDVREQIVLTRLREREVDQSVQVSDTEVDLFLEELKQPGAAGAEYNLAHILVRVPEQASPEAIEKSRAKAEAARREALAGADFARLAAAYSDAPDALRGGALGWRTQERLPELFAQAVGKMKPGEVSPALRSPAGFHVLKLIERRGAAAPGEAVEQTRLRHILIRTGETVSEAEAQRRISDLRERIAKGGADFAELARAQSNDASAARGGELDWLLPGDTVPEFERAVASLGIGELSQPVRTPFGYHLIQVLERRRADMSPERRRLQAMRALRERKADVAYQEWLRQLRDETYVELRLEEK